MASKVSMNSPLTLDGGAFNGAMPISILVLFRSLNLAFAKSNADRLTDALFSKLMPLSFLFVGLPIGKPLLLLYR